MKNIICFLLISLFAFNFVEAQPIKIKKPKKEAGFKHFEFGVSFYNRSSTGFYDQDSDFQTKLNGPGKDSVWDNINKTVFYDSIYTSDYNQFTFVPFCIYHWNPKVSSKLSLSYSMYSIKETYLLDKYNMRRDRFKESLNRLDYISLFNEYHIFDDLFYLDVFADIMAPLSSEKGQLGVSDSSNATEILSDGAFAFNIGTRIGIGTSGFKVSFAPSYTKMSEDFSDKFNLDSRIDISSVPGTRLSLLFNYIKSLGDSDSTKNFTPHREVLQEDGFDVGAEFMMEITDEIKGAISYKGRVFGKNTWNYNGINLTLSYLME